MLKCAYSLSLALFLLPAPGFASGSRPAVEATLNLPFATVLPGVPFDLTVSVKNVSNSPASVGLSAKLRVTLPNGQTFSPQYPVLLEPRPLASEPAAWVELTPGESRQYFVPWGDSAVMWCHGGEYTSPGTYTLVLELAGRNAPNNYAGTLVTSATRLTRVVPAGEDGKLWERMATANGNRWADDGFFNSSRGPAILKEILESHHDSDYYPYALVLEQRWKPRRPTEGDIANALDGAKRFPDSPAYPHLLLIPGEVALSLAHDAVASRNSKAAIEYMTRAEAYFDAALKNTSSIAVHDIAEYNLHRARVGIADEEKRQRSLAAPNN